MNRPVGGRGLDEVGSQLSTKSSAPSSFPCVLDRLCLYLDLLLSVQLGKPQTFLLHGSTARKSVDPDRASPGFRMNSKGSSAEGAGAKVAERVGWEEVVHEVGGDDGGSRTGSRMG